jgi:hypothetical protein
MWLKRVRQTPAEQAKSGLKIAGAIVASTTVLILVAHAYAQIATARGLGNVAAGWLLMAAITATLALTVQYWGRWFGVLPGNVATRLSLGVLVGWFSPKGYMFVGFPVLLWVMAGLSFRFSTMKRVSGIDRATLIISLGCLIASLSGMFSPEPETVGSRLRSPGRSVPVSFLRRSQSSEGLQIIEPTRRLFRDVLEALTAYAPTASCPPSGRKYCVPLIGSVTLRRSSCRSSLRSTKSISEVLTISRSDDV